MSSDGARNWDRIAGVSALRLFALSLFGATLLAAGCTVRVRDVDLLQPVRLRVLPDGVARENVEIEAADSVRLRGWVLMPQRATVRPWLVYYYGNSQTVFSCQYELHRFATELDVNVLAVDLRGYGFSEGEPSFAAFREDGLVVFDWLTRRAEGSPILLFGYSLGGALATCVAAERPAAGVVLSGTATSAAELLARIQKQVPLVKLEPDATLTQSTMQPIERVRALRAPLLVVHGTRDEVAPIEQGRRLFEAAGSMEKRFVEVAGAGHDDDLFAGGPAFEALRQFVDAQRRRMIRDSRVVDARPISRRGAGG